MRHGPVWYDLGSNAMDGAAAVAAVAAVPPPTTTMFGGTSLDLHLLSAATDNDARGRDEMRVAMRPIVVVAVVAIIVRGRCVSTISTGCSRTYR